jgi:hypothetical protein
MCVPGEHGDYEACYQAPECMLMPCLQHFEYSDCSACRPDGKVSFGKATSLERSGISPACNQAGCIALKSAGTVASVAAPIYGGPERRICPAGTPSGDIMRIICAAVSKSVIIWQQTLLQVYAPRSLQ